MYFRSPLFIPFLVLVVTVYFAAPQRLRVAWLVVASLFAIADTGVVDLAVILAVTAVNYGAGRAVAAAWARDDRAAARSFLIAGILVPLMILFTLKYLGFAVQTLNDVLNIAGADWRVTNYRPMLFPFGVSFYTLAGIAYLVELYRRAVPVERNPGVMFLYLGFFPQFLAGPIPRPGALLPQFRERRSFDYAAAVEGLWRIARGLALKLVIADRAAVIVDAVFPSPENPHHYNGLIYALAAVLYAVQIYADFAGYSDMAIGMARMLGIRLGENFRRPYLARSVVDFWRRWHISLTSWFRDYVYIPLGGNRRGPWRQRLNVMIVFALSGLWHGASGTFLVWGVLHGLCMATGLALSSIRARAGAILGLDRVPRLRAAFSVAGVFVLVSFAWIFFRAYSLGHAWTMIARLGDGIPSLAVALSAGDGPSIARFFDVAIGGLTLGFTKQAYGGEALVLVIALTVFWFTEVRAERRERAGAPPSTMQRRWVAIVLALTAVMLFGMKQAPPFLYFDF